VSLTSDLKSPNSPVGAWARHRFGNAKRLYPELTAAAKPVLVRPTGWGDGRDQRWSWSGMACDTMLRWKLGATQPASAVQAGGRVLVGHLDRTDLGYLLGGAPVPEETGAAARMSVLWAMAEQHARYRLTENPLTLVAAEPTDRLLAAVPHDVVADVVAVIDGPGAGLVDELARLGPVEAGLAFRYPGGADLDLLIGTALVEVKTTVSRPGLTDVLQALGYALLAEPGCIDELLWVFPRSGKSLRLPVADVIERIVDEPAATSELLRAELRDVAGIGSA
jgi:hypothetical protein